MVTSYEELSDMHLDVLREIGNIGAGNAATSLGMMLNEAVEIKLPKVKITDFDTAIQSLGGAEALTVGVLVNFKGEANGMIMFLLALEDAKGITEILVGQEEDEENSLSEMKLSAIQEIGNILSSAYITSISTLTGMTIDISIPYIAIDMVGAILSLPMIEFGAVGDKVMFIEESFYTKNEKLDGNVIMFCEIDSLKAIMEKLGIDA